MTFQISEGKCRGKETWGFCSIVIGASWLKVLLFGLHVTDDKRDSIAACIIYWVQLGTRLYAIVIADLELPKLHVSTPSCAGGIYF